jgi:hypothetical protein
MLRASSGMHGASFECTYMCVLCVLIQVQAAKGVAHKVRWRAVASVLAHITERVWRLTQAELRALVCGGLHSS